MFCFNQGAKQRKTTSVQIEPLGLESSDRNVKSMTWRLLGLQQNVLGNKSSYGSLQTIRWKGRCTKHYFGISIWDHAFYVKEASCKSKRIDLWRKLEENKARKLNRVEKTEFAICAKKAFEKEVLRGLELRLDIYCSTCLSLIHIWRCRRS